MKALSPWPSLAAGCIFYMLLLLPGFHSYPTVDVSSTLSMLINWGGIGIGGAAVVLLAGIRRELFAVCYPLLCLVTAVIDFFTLTMGQTLTATNLEIAAVNDATMWATVVTPSLLLSALAATGVGIFIAVLRWRAHPLRALSIILILVGSLSVIFTLNGTARLRGMVSAHLPYSIYYATRDWLRNRTEVSTERHTFDATEVVTTAAEQPNLILVIGEALRADHLSLNGYERPTTPLLQADSLVVSIPDMWSDPTHTYASLPRLLTRADSLHPNLGFEEQSFIPLFRRAGYRSAWLANQDLSSSYAYFAHEADTLIYVNAARSLYDYDPWLDSDMLPPLRRWLEKSESTPSIAILHSIGSHWWYKSHYTDEETVFTPEATHKDVGRLSIEELVNSYDNTVIATDRFLNAIYQMADSLHRPTIILYISDHGEALGENGVRLHGAETEALHRPACIVRYTRSYAELFPDKVAALKHNASGHVTTDFIFHSVLDAASLITPPLNRNESLFAHPDSLPDSLD